jgi:magnesium-transporting ATPase (P-type)
MEIAALLAAGLGDWIDFGVICGILLLNAVVGWYQEKQAADVVASLKGDIAMKAVVIRDGGEVQILAREIVPGDIVSIALPCLLAPNAYFSGYHRGRSKCSRRCPTHLQLRQP